MIASARLPLQKGEMMSAAITATPLVNGGHTLSTAPERLGRLTATDPARPVGELREQYQAQGYLWLKGILDREEVVEFRGRYFETFREAGLLAEGTDARDGINSGAQLHAPTIQRLMMVLVRSAAYESFCLQPVIWQFHERFLGDTVYLHKRKIIRHKRPGDTNATAAHYDLIYLRGGTDQVCSSWIPIGDTSVEMGGLAYLEGSDAWGRRMEAGFAARNADLPPQERVSAYNRNMSADGGLTRNLPELADKVNGRWLVADYESGDMVVHSSYMIHAAYENRDTDGRMRLSTDIRYQLLRDEIDARWNDHWSLDDML